MFLVKLIFVLIILAGVFVYGGPVWDIVKEKVVEFTNPELQRANILDSFKTNFSEIEGVIREVSKNLDNPDYDKKSRLNEALMIIEKSKNDLKKIEQSNPTLIEKTFENLRDLKEGAQNLLFPESRKRETQDCRCE